MSFEFQLVLTEKCNMSCKYCYIKQKPLDMTFEIFENHYNNSLPALMKRYGKDTYHAALFGGEPLLNWDLIERIVPILKSDPRCTLIIAMTNGLAFQDPYKWDYFQKNQLAISLSFDGLWNDKTRPLRNGKSSFDQYMEDPLQSYLKGMSGCKVMVSPDGIDTMVDNYRWFVEEYNMPMPDFSLVRDNIWTNDDVKRFKIESRKLADQYIDYINQGIRTSVGFFQLYILDLIFGVVQGKRPFGCFAGNNGAGFMPDGKVYPCARFGSNERYPIADSEKGLVYNTINILSSPKVINPIHFDRCKSCIIYKYCNVGCTYEQIQNNENGMYSEPVDNVCKLFHILYEESMRITNILKDNLLFKDIINGAINNIG